MERIYFSKQNFDIIFKIVNRKINQEINYQIIGNEQFKNELIKIMKTVYQNRDKFKITPDTSPMDFSKYLSQKVINISTGYFLNSIKQSKKIKSNLDREIESKLSNNVNQISPRPENQFKNQSTDDKYEQILSERSEMIPKVIEIPDFSQKNDVSNEDIQSKYDNLYKERNHEYENMNQSIPIKQQFRTSNNFQISQNLNENIKKNNNPTNKQPINEFISSSDFNPNIELSITNIESEMPKSFSAVSNIDDTVSNNPDDNFDMIPDTVDYETLNNEMGYPIEDNELISDLNVDNDNQFKEETEKYIEEIVPNNMIENSKNSSMESVNKLNYIKLEELSNIIKVQQENMQTYTEKMNSVLQIMNSRNLDKYYETIINLPNLIRSQMSEKFTNRSYSLVVSSRDRDLTNSDFNKYNFKVTFGGDGNNSVVTTNFDRNINSSGVTSSNAILKDSSTITYSSNINFNPTVTSILRNIVMFKLNRVIIPRPRDGIYYPEPYYFVAIDEFESNIMTSKNISERIFCKVHFDKEVVFGGIGDSAVNNDESTGSISTSTLAQDDNGRKFLYYKNEDGNCCKKFFNAPLARLNNLTIKLLDSSGRVLSDTWSDVDYINDCTRTTSGSDYIYTVSNDFLNNSFLKDEIYVMGNNKGTDGSLSSPNNAGEDRISRIDTANTKLYLSTDLGETSSDNALINLTNQVEYIFEVETKEHDLEAKIQSDLV